MTQPTKCDCEEMSCKEDCSRNHTHKGFWCERCHPERYEKTYGHQPTPEKCVHGHTPEEIKQFGCETGKEYQGVTFGEPERCKYCGFSLDESNVYCLPHHRKIPATPESEIVKIEDNSCKDPNCPAYEKDNPHIHLKDPYVKEIPPESVSWEREFDEKFASVCYMDYENGFELVAGEDIKSFIRQIISYEQKESYAQGANEGIALYKKELGERIGGMPTPSPTSCPRRIS